MQSSILLIVGILLAIYFGLSKLLVLPHDAKEPPLIPQSVPIFGHMIGMIRHGSKYYSKVTKRWQYPIYTLGLPNSKVYIVNSPHMISIVDRHAKTISFAPFIVQFAKRILVPSPASIDKLSEDLLEENPEPCLRHETLEAMHKTLATGDGLESSTKEVVASLNRLLNPLGEEDGGLKVYLFSWIRSIVTVSSTDAIYGQEKNPLRDPKVQEGFWSIDDDFALLGLNILPGLLAPKGSKGRKLFFDALNKYYQVNGQETGSQVVQARYNLNRKAGISIDDIAHFDLSVCYGTLVNTVPGTSWALYYLFSNPSLLNTMRPIILSAVGITNPEERISGHRRVNIAAVVRESPLLSSLIRETLRIQSTNAAARIILKDTIIEDRYLLKKDALLFIPSEDVHNNESVWGPTAKSFDPYRFLAENKKVPASAYRAFGSGASVCPGRILATNEICTILIMMVLRFDIRPASGDDKWEVVEGVPHFTKSILTPGKDIPVVLEKRENVKGVNWDFYWDSSEVS